MARIAINQRRLRANVRAQAVRRGRAALVEYKRFRRKQDDASSPFAKGPGPRRTRIESKPDGIRIVAESPGAEFFEFGNDDGGARDEILPKNRRDLWIMLKSKSGAGLRNKNLRITIGDDGKPYLVLRKVKTYAGRFALRKSVLTAFGLKRF